jgi:Leucine-rich repeat (LRR) protein
VNYTEFVDGGEFGPKFTVVGDWKDDYATFMFDKGINELSLNYACGFTGPNLSFLPSLQFLTGLNVLTYHIDDISPIEGLPNLRSLKIYRSGKRGLDFRLFPHLERLTMQYRPKSDSLFECLSLTKLYLSNYPSKESESFASLKGLTTLELTNGPMQDLSGLAALGELRELGLYYLRALPSLRGIEDLTLLYVLNIDTCRKITAIDQVSNMLELKELYFANCGDIASIKPIGGLKKLEIVRFWDSTNVLDGDLSALEYMPNLRDVRFTNRKHYSLRCEQFAPFGGDNPEYPKRNV